MSQGYINLDVAVETAIDVVFGETVIREFAEHENFVCDEPTVAEWMLHLKETDTYTYHMWIPGVYRRAMDPRHAHQAIAARINGMVEGIRNGEGY